MKGMPESRTDTKRMNKQLPSAGTKQESHQAEKNGQNDPVIIGIFQITGDSVKVNFPEGKP